MASRLESLEDIAPCLASARSLYVSGCAAQIPGLEQVMGLTDGDDELILSGIFLPGLNRLDYAAVGERVHCQTFFMTPQMASAEHSRVRYCPWRYRDIVRFYCQNPVDVALVMLSPPDANGYCSYGVAGDFAPFILPAAGIRIGVVNSQMPRTPGSAIALESLDHWLEIDSPLLETPHAKIDAVSTTIAGHVASFVEDGATLQLGLGSIPSAVAGSLRDRRGLRIRSGLVEPSMQGLEHAGALSPDSPVMTGVALGDASFYRFLDGNPRLSFQPVTVTHDIEAIASTPSFIAINGALQVDVLGQINSSVLPGGFLSGPGGLPEFVAGALRSPGGRSIIALNATAGGGAHSRIVTQLERSASSVAFTDADTVVTEFGVAELRGKSLSERVALMIGIADPRHRDALEEAARALIL